VPVNEALPGNMISLLTNQLSSYIHYEEEIKTFTFIHESIMEVLMSSFVRFHPQHILESKYYFFKNEITYLCKFITQMLFPNYVSYFKKQTKHKNQSPYIYLILYISALLC